MRFSPIRSLRSWAAVPLFAFAIVTAATQFAAGTPTRPNGYPVTNVNLRAGPGTDFPVIVTVPNRAWISILGCLADYGWCDVFFEGNRGWMRSIYLAGWYQGYYYPLRDYAPQLGYPVVTFDVGTYWDAYYRGRPFYPERARWEAPSREGWVDRGVFYDRLAPYGQWTWLEGQYVFVPGGVDRSWRPYTNGRWVYTDRYGWMWISNEPYGWATYHYGRWGFSKRIGWFWVPGRRWAPAWVSWRQSDDYLAWAPLPPTYDEDVSIDVSVRDVPSYYWQAVRSDQFLAPDLPRRIVRDPQRIQPVLERTQPIGNVVVNNTVVVNNVVSPQFVEEKTKEKVVVHKVEETNDAAQASKVQGAAVEVFQPKPDQKPAVATPPKPVKIEEVAAESKTKEQAGAAPATDTMLLPPEIKAPEAVQATPPAPPPTPAKEAKPAAEQAEPPPPPPPAKDATPPGAIAAQPLSPGEEAAPAASEHGASPPQPAGETTPAPTANGKSMKEKTPLPPPGEGTLPPAGEAATPPAGEEPGTKAKKKAVPSGDGVPTPTAEEPTPQPKMEAAPAEQAAPPPPPAEGAVSPPAGEAGAAPEEQVMPKPHKKKVAPPQEEAAPASAGQAMPPASAMGEEVAPKPHRKVAPPSEETLPPGLLPPAEQGAPPPAGVVGPKNGKWTKPPAGEGAASPGDEVPHNHKKAKHAGQGEEGSPVPPSQAAPPPPPAGEAPPPPPQ